MQYFDKKDDLQSYYGIMALVCANLPGNSSDLSKLKCETLAVFEIGLGIFSPNSLQHLRERTAEIYKAHSNPFLQILELMHSKKMNTKDALQSILDGVSIVERILKKTSGSVESESTLHSLLRVLDNKYSNIDDDFSDSFFQKKEKTNTEYKRRKTFSFNPTEEQIGMIDYMRSSGNNFKVQGYAGCGKSTTIELMHQRTQDQYRNNSLYLAFNKPLVENIRNSDVGLKAFTFDGFAFQQIKNSPWSDDMVSTDKIKPSIISEVLGIQSQERLAGSKIKGNQISLLVQQVVDNFVNSRDEDISDHHIINTITDLSAREYLLHHAKNLWASYISTPLEFGSKPIKPSFLTKEWSLRSGSILDNIQRVYIDEAQDINGAFMNILENSKNKTQIIFCGDQYQQLYAWRGAENAMQKINVDSLPLTSSFRFGNEIAELSNLTLKKLVDNPSDLITSFNNKETKIIPYCGVIPDQVDVLLTRGKASLFQHSKELAKRKLTFSLNIDIRSFCDLLLSALALYHKDFERVFHPEIRTFSHWFQFKSHVESSMDSELALCEKIIEKNHDTLKKDIALIAKANERDPHNAKVILSTTHRIKGRDWSKVALSEDFIYCLERNEKNIDQLQEEIRILYVALTRAKDELYIPERLLSYINY